MFLLAWFENIIGKTGFSTYQFYHNGLDLAIFKYHYKIQTRKNTYIKNLLILLSGEREDS